VTQKVKAGYLNDYADQEYTENLQHISVSFLGSAKDRSFPVEGDSMPPHEDSSAWKFSPYHIDGNGFSLFLFFLRLFNIITALQ